MGRRHLAVGVETTSTLRALDPGTGTEGCVLGWLRRRRRRDDAGRKRLLIALARAEEALIETHVANVLDVFDAVGDDIPLDRLLDIYLAALEPGEPRATIIARRVLARLERSDDAPDDRPARRSRRRAGKAAQR